MKGEVVSCARKLLCNLAVEEQILHGFVLTIGACRDHHALRKNGAPVNTQTTQ